VEGRREEPPGAKDGTHVPCWDCLGDGQGHGPSILTLVYYLDTRRTRRTAAVPHGGVSLELPGAQAFQRPLRVIGGARDSGCAGSHGSSRALGSAITEAKKGREVQGTMVK